ncbi:hypothetical protein UFOVP328_64 [uncultured Caudovirales phage]|uniref:Uncharacterized protein n=1 Tax=uncultured Caudovirales phage TaxID=2100421 RepID=A0A6J5LXE1_9CAUD|nr:hypothetical protein UFOVP328_64 [uncultured Caudovirales phage]
MKLKSFGCSFIYGTDLASTDLTWPGLLAQHINYEYQCHARPGSGNLQILEKILNQTTTNDSAFYVVGWTWIDRFDYAEPANDQWKTIMPVDTDKIASNYYRDLHSQYRDKLTTLIYIKTAIDCLKQKNYPFVMTYMDELIFETEWHTTPAVIDIQNYIKPYMTKFENKTFLDFSKEKGFPISETLHPLENAHQAAFELIRSYNLV